MLVFTSDGDELGRIKAIEGGCFKLDIMLQRDYWLEKDAVSSTEFGVARLKLPKDAFNQQTGYDTGHTGIDTEDPEIPEASSGIAGHSGIHLH